MIDEIIRKAKTENRFVYIFAHIYPDGDAIGAALALREYLKSNGVGAEYVVTDTIVKYKGLVDKIYPVKKVKKNSIAVILDTPTKVRINGENLISNGAIKKEDIYVLDHHQVEGDERSIENELGIPMSNLIRRQDESSTCEILLHEFMKEEINTQVANMLTLGLLTDTGKLRYLEPNTMRNLARLVEMGAEYDRIVHITSKRNNPREEVGIARSLLDLETIDLGSTFGVILAIDNSKSQNIWRTYGIRMIEKRVYRMSAVDNCAFSCIIAENKPGEINVSFRSSRVYGNYNVAQIAQLFDGRGRRNASGCVIKGSNIEDVKAQIIGKAKMLYTTEEKFPEPQKSKQLMDILGKTKNFTQNVTYEILLAVANLNLRPDIYEYTVERYRTLKKFMLQNELLNRVDFNKKDVVIKPKDSDIKKLKQKYGVQEADILDAIDIFTNMDINSATVLLPNGNGVTINREGTIENMVGNEGIEPSTF